MPISKLVKEPHAGPSVSDRVSEAVEQTKSKITEFGSAAADKIDQNRAAAASGLEDAAHALHQRAEQLPGGERMTNLAHSAADRVSATADYVRQNDVNSMRSDVKELVKKNPGLLLLIAAGLGFLIGRALKGNSRG